MLLSLQFYHGIRVGYDQSQYFSLTNHKEHHLRHIGPRLMETRSYPYSSSNIAQNSSLEKGVGLASEASTSLSHLCFHLHFQRVHTLCVPRGSFHLWVFAVCVVVGNYSGDRNAILRKHPWEKVSSPQTEPSANMSGDAVALQTKVYSNPVSGEQHGGSLVNTVTSPQECPGFEPCKDQLGPFFVELNTNMCAFFPPTTCIFGLVLPNLLLLVLFRHWYLHKSTFSDKH